MKHTDREKIYRALLGNIEDFVEGSTPDEKEAARKILRDAAAEDLKNVEPHVDRIISDAVGEALKHRARFEDVPLDTSILCKCGAWVTEQGFVKHVLDAVARVN